MIAATHNFRQPVTFIFLTSIDFGYSLYFENKTQCVSVIITVDFTSWP